MTALPAVTLVLGGMRSGKSEYAEHLIEAHGPGLYVATAEILDTEMAERVRRHRERRGSSWITVEEPLDLAVALGDHVVAGRAVLIDCLTLWLSNLLAAGRDPQAEAAALAAALAGLPAPVVLVSNEVGLGIVPDNALARAFADAAGRLNQAMAATADQVVLVSAGLPLVLKDSGP
jgi:adenosylcobinamide kinase / adenosylcobinamide-phosphate guanylyltransferase